MAAREPGPSWVFACLLYTSKANPELAAKLELFFSGKAPKVDWAAIEQKAGSATRAALSLIHI